jgi:hypothetical protein
MRMFDLCASIPIPSELEALSIPACCLDSAVQAKFLIDVWYMRLNRAKADHKLFSNFILRRGLTVIPFTFLIGFVFHGRPRLLPYFVCVHMGFSVALLRKVEVS